MYSIKLKRASVVVAYWRREKNNIYSNFIIELLFAFRISCDVDSTFKMAFSYVGNEIK